MSRACLIRGKRRSRGGASVSSSPSQRDRKQRTDVGLRVVQREGWLGGRDARASRLSARPSSDPPRRRKRQRQAEQQTHDDVLPDLVDERVWRVRTGARAAKGSARACSPRDRPARAGEGGRRDAGRTDGRRREERAARARGRRTLRVGLAAWRDWEGGHPSWGFGGRYRRRGGDGSRAERTARLVWTVDLLPLDVDPLPSLPYQLLSTLSMVRFKVRRVVYVALRARTPC